MEENFEINDLINMIPLNESNAKLAQDIIDESDIDKVKDLTHLFNLNQAKKNVLRVLKLNSLLDKVSDQMIERFTKQPGAFSNSDLLNYMQVTQSAIDRANKALNLVDETPAIQINQQVNNINVGESLDRESRDRIKDAVNAILKRTSQLDIELDKSDDVVIIEEAKEEKPQQLENQINMFDSKLNNEEEEIF